MYWASLNSCIFSSLPAMLTRNLISISVVSVRLWAVNVTSHPPPNAPMVLPTALHCHMGQGSCHFIHMISGLKEALEEGCVCSLMLLVAEGCWEKASPWMALIPRQYSLYVRSNKTPPPSLLDCPKETLNRKESGRLITNRSSKP